MSFWSALMRRVKPATSEESTRSRLLARREELGRLLEDPGAGGQQVPELYAELQQIHAVLSEREAERRTRVPARRTRSKRRR